VIVRIFLWTGRTCGGMLVPRFNLRKGGDPMSSGTLELKVGFTFEVIA
tara:strand:+ start:6182 stop:6325 length:144 start_codon:yes stop_codon:yes gene_type:complete